MNSINKKTHGKMIYGNRPRAGYEIHPEDCVYPSLFASMRIEQSRDGLLVTIGEQKYTISPEGLMAMAVIFAREAMRQDTKMRLPETFTSGSAEHRY